MLLTILSSCSFTHCDSVKVCYEESVKGKITDKYQLKWNRDSPELDILEKDGVSHIYLFMKKADFGIMLR
jgi:hypothetical protein